jgi:hypothetical protein
MSSEAPVAEACAKLTALKTDGEGYTCPDCRTLLQMKGMHFAEGKRHYEWICPHCKADYDTGTY